MAQSILIFMLSLFMLFLPIGILGTIVMCGRNSKSTQSDNDSNEDDKDDGDSSSYQNFQNILTDFTGNQSNNL